MLYHFFAGRDVPATYAHLFARSKQQRGRPGPGGRLGCLVCRHGPVPDLDSQSLPWQQLAPDWWVAVHGDESPAIFARRAHALGHLLTLADGQAYLIPVADPEAAACSLPLAEGLSWDASRQSSLICRAPLPQHQALAQLATRAACSLRLSLVTEASAAVTLEDHEVRTLIHLALAANYDLLPEEILALRLVDEARRHAIISIIIDLPGILTAVQASLAAAARLIPEPDALPFVPSASPPLAPAPSASPPPAPPAPISSFPAILSRLRRALGLPA